MWTSFETNLSKLSAKIHQKGSVWLALGYLWPEELTINQQVNGEGWFISRCRTLVKSFSSKAYMSLIKRPQRELSGRVLLFRGRVFKCLKCSDFLFSEIRSHT